MTRLLAITALATLTLPGCILIGGDDCDYYQGAPEVDAIGLLNPYTGQCEYQGGGGGSICGNYGGDDIAEPAPADWATCTNECTGLTEDTCLDTLGCRAAYVGDCPEGLDCDSTTYSFVGCWAVAPSGPVQGGECAGLDAYSCSRRDDCTVHHYPYNSCSDTGANCAPIPDPTRAGNFEYCANEIPPQPTCAEAASEATCISRVECAPIYVGVNCACDDQTGECACQDWLFDQCTDA